MGTVQQTPLLQHAWSGVDMGPVVHHWAAAQLCAAVTSHGAVACQLRDRRWSSGGLLKKLGRNSCSTQQLHNKEQPPLLADAATADHALAFAQGCRALTPAAGGVSWPRQAIYLLLGLAFQLVRSTDTTFTPMQRVSAGCNSKSSSGSSSLDRSHVLSLACYVTGSGCVY